MLRAIVISFDTWWYFSFAGEVVMLLRKSKGIPCWTFSWQRVHLPRLSSWTAATVDCYTVLAFEL